MTSFAKLVALYLLVNTGLVGWFVDGWLIGLTPNSYW
jgi:hypothetical protein